MEDRKKGTEGWSQAGELRIGELLLASQGASCFTVPRGTPTGYPPRPEGSSYYCK